MTERPSPPSNHIYVRVMWIVLAVSVALVVFGNAIISALAVFGAAYSIWNLVMIVPGKVSRTLEGRSRWAFTITTAALFPLLLSLYFLQRASDFDPWSSILYFMGWYALIPIVIIGYLSQSVARSMIDKDHPITGLLVTACLLFVPMFLGYHGINLSTEEDGYSSSNSVDPVELNAKQKAGYDFVVYLVYIGISYTGIAYGLARKRAEDRKLDAALARIRKP